MLLNMISNDNFNFAVFNKVKNMAISRWSYDIIIGTHLQLPYTKHSKYLVSTLSKADFTMIVE